MASRYTICLLFATWLSFSGVAGAQSVPFWAQDQGSGYGQPGANSGGSPYGGSYGGPMQAAYNPGMGSGSAGLEDSYVMPYAEPSYLEHTPDNHEPLWQPNRPIEHFLTKMFEDSFIRLEYLQWDVSRPGDQLLGAPVQGVPEPRRFFPVFDDNFTRIGFAKVMDMSPITLNDSQGIRGTFGTSVGDTTDFEMNFWGLDQRTQSFSPRFLPQTVNINPVNGNFFGNPDPLVIATSTLFNGQFSNNVFLWDLEYRIDFTSEFWGTEVKILNEHGYWGPGVTFQSLYGFQYVQAHERLQQTGFASTGQIGRIDSNVMNHIYGPTLGVRGEYAHEWFSLGIEPKVALALNSHDGQVSVSQLRSMNDPTVNSAYDRTDFAPIMQLAVFAKVRLNDRFNFYVSFDGTWLTSMARAHTAIRYNDNGANSRADVTAQSSRQGVFLHGLTAGGEVILW